VKFKDESIIKTLKTIFNDNKIFLFGISALNFFIFKDIYNYFLLSNIEITDLYRRFDKVYKLNFAPFDYVLIIDGRLIYLKIFNYISNDTKSYLTEFTFKIDHPLLLPYFYDINSDIFYDLFSIGSLYKSDLINENIKKGFITNFGNNYLVFDKKYKIWNFFYYKRYFLERKVMFKNNIIENEIFKEDEIDYKNEKNIINDSSLEKKSYQNLFSKLNKSDQFSFIYFFLIDRLNYYLLRILEKNDLIRYIFPELLNLKSVYHDKENHPEGDAFEHSLRTLKYIDSNDFIFVFSTLFHDIGKYEVKDQKISSKEWKFPYHSKLGFQIAQKILNRWKEYIDFLENSEDRVHYLIGNHMNISFLNNLEQNEQEKILKNKDLNNLLKLYKADLQSSMADLNQYKKIVSFIRKKGISL
jgi:hypothetical protein